MTGRGLKQAAVVLWATLIAMTQTGSATLAREPGGAKLDWPDEAAMLAPQAAATAIPSKAKPGDHLAAAGRKARLAAVRSWGIQLQGVDVGQAGAAAYDMLVVDGTAGAKDGTAFNPADVAALKARPNKPDRLVISYLSIGEAEDYRQDYFNSEYMTEDAPDWLLSENERWKGNRRIRFCEEGWQRTILGDEDGRNVYNSVEPSPLYRLIEAGFDGVYLDRVDVYAEVETYCSNAAARMVAFVARLAAHARKTNPNFMVILQNAEELLQHKAMVSTIDAVAKEDLFYGSDHSQNANSPVMVRDTLRNLSIAREAGKPVFILDYVSDADKRALDRSKIMAQGFIPYFGPRALDRLWLQENSP